MSIFIEYYTVKNIWQKTSVGNFEKVSQAEYELSERISIFRIGEKNVSTYYLGQCDRQILEETTGPMTNFFR